MIRIFGLCVRDFFTRKFILLSLVPFFVSLAFLLSIVFIFGSDVANSLRNFALGLVENDGFFAVALSSEFLLQALDIFIYGFGIFIALMLGVVCAGFISGFFTPLVSEFTNAKYYKIVLNKKPSNVDITLLYAKVIRRFIVFLILSLFLLFIPFFGVIAVNATFFYLFYEFMLIDVASNCCDEMRFKLTMMQGGEFTFKIWALIFYLACLIPLVGLFFQLFFIMFFSHLLLSKQGAK